MLNCCLNMQTQNPVICPNHFPIKGKAQTLYPKFTSCFLLIYGPLPTSSLIAKTASIHKVKKILGFRGAGGAGRISSYPSSLRTPWGNLSIWAARSNLYILLSNFVSKTQAEESSALGGQESDSTELNKHRKVMSKTATTAAAAIDEPISN